MSTGWALDHINPFAGAERPFMDRFVTGFIIFLLMLTLFLVVCGLLVAIMEVRAS